MVTHRSCLYLGLLLIPVLAYAAAPADRTPASTEQASPETPAPETVTPDAAPEPPPVESAAPAPRDQRLMRDERMQHMLCQQNLDDRRILVANGHSLPPGAQFRILSYDAKLSRNGWSFGTCDIAIIVKP